MRASQMMSFRSVMIPVLLRVFLLVIDSIPVSSLIDSSCLDILCKTATNCDRERRCLGSGSAHCGPFDISLSYWKDSGSPGNSFHACAFSFNCSASSVSNFLIKFSKDCDRNGVIDCADYAAIHTAGHDHCGDEWVAKSAFMQTFFSHTERAAEESHVSESRVSFVDSSAAELRELGRVSGRRRIASTSGRGPNFGYDARNHVHEILSSLDPWILSTGSRRTNRRPVSNRPDTGTHRRRVRPQGRPAAVPSATVSTPLATRVTQPYTAAPVTRRRLRTTMTPLSTLRTRPVVPVTEATLPWWRLATSTLPPYSPTATTTASTTAFATAVPRVSAATEAPVSRRVTFRYLDFSSTTSSPTSATSTTAAPSTTRKSTIKPTFNPIRMNSESPSVNDVDVPRNATGKSNVTIPVMPLTDSCMECICSGSSGCNLDTSVKCHGEEECGPYHIDYAYWYEAGYPGFKGNDDDFSACATNRTCAEKAVRTYVTDNRKDCNGDSVIDCLDYASVHKAGPDACNTDWMFDSKFWTGFSACFGFDEKEMHRRRR